MKGINNNWWIHQNKKRGIEHVTYRNNIEERSRRGVEQFLFPSLIEVENNFQNQYSIKCINYTLNKNLQYLH
ncbi:MAG: hypothetical protein VXZ40_02755 [Nanoarchaeota archaeon]|nr:hypothetical protein [Nanoarchaeota archaeon]